MGVPPRAECCDPLSRLPSIREWKWLIHTFGTSGAALRDSRAVGKKRLDLCPKSWRHKRSLLQYPVLSTHQNHKLECTALGLIPSSTPHNARSIQLPIRNQRHRRHVSQEFGLGLVSPIGQDGHMDGHERTSKWTPFRPKWTRMDTNSGH